MENTTKSFVSSGTSDMMIDTEWLISKANDYLAKALIPVVVYLALLMISGILGNSLVLYVYKFRFRRSTSRAFILTLATYDLITCIFGMPFHIIDMMYPYEFQWGALCKFLSFSVTFTIFGSILVLDLIAIDRYRKICKPMQKQLSSSGTKIICWMTIFVAALLGLPIVFLYDSTGVEITKYNVTGKECYIATELLDTVFPYLYDGLNILVFISTILIVSALYILVGNEIKKRSKTLKLLQESQRSTSGQNSPMCSVRSRQTEELVLNTQGSMKDKIKPMGESSHAPIIRQTSRFKSLSLNSPRIQKKGSKDKSIKEKLQRMMSDVSSDGNFDSTGTLERGQGVTSHPEMKKRKHKRLLKITTMLFVITVIFVVSFLPYLTIQILGSADDTFWDDRETWSLVLLNMLMRTYFINNMVNPIVYWCLDRKFKDEVVKLFFRCKTCYKA